MIVFDEQTAKQSISCNFSLTPVPETCRAIHQMLTPFYAHGWRHSPYEPKYHQKSMMKIQTLKFRHESALIWEMTPTGGASIWCIDPLLTRALFEPRNSILSESETCKKTMWRKNSNFRDLAQIEADEAETWHTLRLHIYLSMRQVWASYLSIYFSKFQMNLAAQITAVCRHSRAQSYHYRKNFYSKK